MSRLPSSTYPAIFVLCMGLLYFELFLVRILSFVGGAHSIYLTIAFAMLGLASASSVVSIIPENNKLLRSRNSVPILSAMVSWSILLTLIVAWIMKGKINQLEQAAIGRGGFAVLLESSADISFISICVMGTVASIVYFFFGAALSILFRRAVNQEFGRLYAFDLIGACLGCILLVLATEFLPYFHTALLSIFFPALSSILFSNGKGFVGRYLLIGNALIVLVATTLMGNFIEPRPLMERLARDYAGTGETEELWRVWNSYGRISGIKYQSPNNQDREIIVHGNGEGHATVPVQPRAPDTIVKLSVDPESNEPVNVLVLLAGAGADMISLDKFLPVGSTITGVELVHDVFKQPYDLNMGDTRNLLDKQNIKMVRAEAREFLARNKSKYDLIVVSWSGASLSYFSGAASSAADYIYTREALSSLLSHLTSNGELILLNGNKIRHILALREIFADQPYPLPVNKSIVVSNDYKDSDFGMWWQPWDNQRLIVKPSGIGLEDVRRISRNERIIYSPFPEYIQAGHETGFSNEQNKVIYDFYQRAVTDDPVRLLTELRSSYGVDLSVVTDNRPFILDTFPFEYYFSGIFWISDSPLPDWKLKKRHLQFVFLFSIAAVILIMVPLWISRARNKTSGKKQFAFSVYFCSIGAGFMFFEIALISRLQLLIGHPGYVIAFVLAAVILFTGLGSLSLNRNLSRYRITPDKIAVGAVASMVIVWLVFGLLEQYIISLPFLLKCSIAFLMPAVPCYLMGHLFPLGMRRLTRLDEQLVPWALAVNGVSGTLATGTTLIIAQAFGYNTMVILGALFYLLAALSRISPAQELSRTSIR